VEVFEVDAARTQVWKLSRLADLGLAVPPNLHFASTDFEANTSFVESLGRTSFDRKRPALIAATGVTQYITAAALRATMREAACLASGTRFACSFILPADLVDSQDQDAVSYIARRAASKGHPWVSRYRPSELIALAYQVGFAQVRDVSADELRRLYFANRADGFQPTTAEHLLVATV
jgi:O-methyltransferase involved in polyketide biosynthesis